MSLFYPSDEMKPNLIMSIVKQLATSKRRQYRVHAIIDHIMGTDWGK